jgi:hypothetical protein
LPDINLALWPSFAFLAGDGTPPDSAPGSISPTRG